MRFFFVLCNIFRTFAYKMLEKVQGIVLRTVKFGDTKMIVDLFTLGHGRQSFVASVTHSRMSKGQMAFWAPLSMVEFQADIRPTSTSLPKPKDVRLYYNYIDVPFNPIKSAIALFLAEFLSASLKSESTNIPLYRFLETSLQWFDNVSSAASISNFHLVFLLRLTRFIGILPNIDLPDDGVRARPVFDLQSSTYIYIMPSHKHFLSVEESAILPILFRINYSTMHLLRLTRSQRARFLEVLEEYYGLHVPSFPQIKSIEILHEVFA